MNFIKENYQGICICLAIAIPAWFLGNLLPIIGGAVIAIIAGMIIAIFFNQRKTCDAGIKFVSKKVLQWAVVLLGFGLNLGVIFETGKQSLPIIIYTIATSLIIAFIVHKMMRIPSKISTLIGVGSSICGGSAIAATAPVINADDEEVAQAISVIFFYNVLAAIIFPILGNLLEFSTVSGEAFGIFTGTAVNDTSSVTAAASTWDGMWNLGSQTLDKAVTVKLTRTLAIIPITLVLAFVRAHKEKNSETKIPFSKIFPFFILYFVLASVITTIAMHFGTSEDFFTPIKTLSKFLIVVSMAAIGLNTNIVKLVKTGGKPMFLGACCWIGITIVCLSIQYFIGLW